MEGRGRSRARKKHRIIVPKRLVAFMMTALMVFTTIGPDLSVAFAASEADVVFELDGADLVQSVEDAVAEGNEVTKEDVNFTDGDVDRYEELFFGEGKLYEAYPELNAGGSDADLRVFVRLPEDADESYIVTGDEELLFLFINNSDEAMTCRADITRVINGKERTKKTRTMLVKSYMNVFDYIFGDAEVPEEIEDAVENGTLATDSDASNNNEEVPTATDSDAAVTLSLKDVPRVTAPADAVATDSDASKDETDTEDQTPADDETNADANGPAADDADEEKETSGEKPAVSAGDLVGIDWCSTARVYTTTLNKLGLEIPELVVKEGSYELTINHLLVDDAGTWGKTETISLSEEDFEDGLLDTAAYEYTKDGMELAEKAPVVKAGAFEGEDGTYTLSVDMAYRVMDGWHIVPEEPDSGIMLMAVYIGELDDVTIVPDEDHVIVTINLYDQDGITIQNPIKVQQDKNDDGTASFEYELELPTGYTVESVSENAVYEEGKLTSEIPVDTEAWTIDVTCTVGTATYTIKIYEQNLEDDNYTLKSTSDDNIGTIGSLTEVVADPKTGFTAGIITQEEISADNSTVVEVYYNRNIYRLYYNTNKGSYIRSTTGKYGATISLADAAPTKTGYRFDGWYSDSTLSNKITEVTLQGDTTVYAKWVGDVVNYNIVYMIENADDDNYSYAGTAKGRAQAGTTVTLDKTQADRSAVSANVDLEHFTFKESTTVEIEPDGSSVITVKYSRKTYTITFHGEQAKILTCGEEAHEHSIWNGCYKWNGWRFVLDCDKRPHTHGNGCYSSGTTLYLTAKYQQDIGAKWLELVGPDTIYAGRSWRWDDSYYTSYQQIMPGENKHIYPNDSGDIVWNLYYYLEDPDGDVSYKGKKFTQEIAIVLNVSSGTTLTFDEEFCPIDGYDRYGSNVKGWENGQEGNTANAYYPSSDGAAKFYYTLSRYDLELVDGASTQSIPKYYKESISDVLEMEGILSVTEGTFDGWYFDPEFENPYSGDETMPKGGLVLYAKRVGVTHEVKFMDSMTDTVYDTQSVEDRDCVEIPDIPEKRGYVFDGWYTERACTNAFDYTTPITGDTTVYAKWIQSTTTTYTVYHQVADGTGFINIVEPEVISGMVGATVQARPLSASSMPEEYEGYVADKISDKCILKADPDENSIYFTYTKIDAYRYHVEYTYNGQVIDAFTEETQTTPANQITVHATLTDAMKEAGYKLSDIPAERSKRVTLTSQEATVTFALDVAVYTISYDLDGGTLTTANPEKYTANGFSVEGAAQLPITLNNPTKENWVFDGWELGTGTSVKLGDTHDKLTTVLSVGTYGNLSFKATWKREQVDGKVIYYFDDTENSSLEENPKWNVGETVYGTPSTEATSYAAANKYVLDKIDPVSLTVAKGSTNVIKIYYAKDDNGNGVPDKYEATVSYKVEGGTFKEAEGTDKTTVTQTYNMKKWDEASKTWVDDPKKLENIPTPEAGTGYDPASGAWVGEEPTNDTIVEDGKEYTYKYGLKNLGLTIKYVDEDGEELQTATGRELLYGGSYDLVTDNTIENARMITVGTGSDEKQYVLDSIEGAVTGNNVTEAVTVTLVYSLDEDENEVPDKYQATVSYKVEGGTFKEAEGTDKTTVTQTYNMKKWDEASKTWVDDPKKLENIPTPEAGTGYDPASGAWVGEEPTNDTTVEDGKEYTYKYGLKNLGLTIKYVDEDGEELQTATGRELLYGGSYDLVTDNTIENARVITVGTGSDEKQYVLDSIEGAVTGNNVTEAVTVTLVYSLDEDENEVPDKYQATVSYKVEGGTFKEAEGTDKTTVTQTYNMKKWDEASKTWVDDPKKLENIPTPEAGTGYDPASGAWVGEEPTNDTTVEDGKEYTYKYGLKNLGLTIKYVDEDGEELKTATGQDLLYGGSYDLVADNTIENARVITVGTGSDEKQYVLDSIEGAVTGSNVTEAVTVTLVYSLDEDENEVPDKYQATVSYKVEGGTFKEAEGTDKTTVTQTYNMKKWDEASKTWVDDPKKLENIPTPEAGTGYDPASGAWVGEEPTNDTTVEDGKEYTYKYGLKNLGLTIKYVDEDGEELQTATGRELLYGGSYDLVTDNTIENARVITVGTGSDEKQYVLDSIEGAVTGSNVTEAVTVTLVYSLDEDENEVPDKYQATVSYKVEGGTFKEAEGTDKTTVTQTYNMKKWDEASKTWVDDPKKLENIPTPEAGTGYDPASGAWVGEEPTNDTTVEDGKEYTYKYGLKNLGLTIKYVDEDGEELKTATGQDLLYGGSYDLVTDNTIENARVITVGTGSDEKQYVLDSIEGAVTGSNVTEAVTVTLVYSLDEDENRVPDKYQKTVVYEVVKGYFNNDKELIEVEQHYVMATRDEDTNVWTPKDIYLENIPNPTPKEGYGNGKWTPATPTDATRVDAADKYVHTYTAQPRTLKVNYVDDQGNVLRNPYTADTFYNEPYDLADQILDNIEYEGQKYVYDGMSGDETSGTVKDSVEITVIYSLDANEDTVADKYQIEVVFAAVNGTFDENGTTQLEKIVTLKDPVTEEPSEDGTYTFPKDLVPTATPATGYVQPGVWDKDPAVTAITKTENHTFTITFDDKDKYQVTVEYYFDDVKDEDMTKTSDASFETIYEVTPDKAIVHNDTAYALDRVENNGLLVSSDSTKNVVKVYYALDEKGGKPGTEEPDEPGKPDEIPDKYQLVFRYRTDGNGTVTGTTYETHTFTDDDGNYTEISATSPKVAVTVSGNTSRYVFDYWTDDDGNRYETDADLKAATFTEDMTFTAHFDYTGGGSSSGGGGGGGGGTSSGSDPNNGPGVVNIEDGDVPLAPLPGDNGLYVIEDGDVPLAPLPKTGQKPMAATVGMLFSGILLALSTLRKRKEEN